jgi:DNA replication protein DnaC
MKEVEGHEYVYAAPCSCRMGLLHRQRKNRFGISEDFQSMQFEGFKDLGIPKLKTAKQTAMDYCDSFDKIKKSKNNSIIFMGQAGCGKTHLSMAICNKLMQEKNVSAIYFSYRQSVTELKQTATDRSAYIAAIDSYKKAQLLMIDDMLKGRTSGADLNALFELINYRYLNNLPMVISTEMTMQQLLEFDEALMSRVYEMTKGHQIEIIGTGLNYRLR